MDIDADMLNAIADKIAAADLSGDERAVIDGILARAAMAEPDDVTGYVAPAGLLARLRPGAEPFAAALGLISGPPSGGSLLQYGP